MNDLERQVLRIIGENPDAPDVFADTAEGMAPIRDSINDAIQELCMLSGSYKRVYYLPLYANRQFYRMQWETDFFGWVVEAWDRNRKYRLSQTDLIKVSKNNRGWMQQTGNPIHYMQIGMDIIGLYYKPSSSGTVLELECVCIPRPYKNDTDPIKLRDTYQQAATYYAISEYYASRGDAKRATEYLSRYTEAAGLMTLKPEAENRQYRYSGGANNVNALS